MTNLDWYHAKGSEVSHESLTKEETYDKDSDWEDIKDQRDYRDRKKAMWDWAGSVYNVVQNAIADDQISNIVLGWIRTYIDTGISQITNGEPDFDYVAFGPTDNTKEKLWGKATETMLSNSYYYHHQKTAITDAHVFGSGVLEVYQGTQYRTLRVPKEDGTFEDKVVVDYRKPRCGVRAVSPHRVTRNPNVSDPSTVGSCTKEELLTWNQFVVGYGRCKNKKGECKYKNIDKVAKGKHVKITKYQDEDRDVFRIYALSYGNESDKEATDPPSGQLGVPIFDRPLKIHDIYNKKGELLRSMGLNIPGMCNLIFLPYLDKLNTNYESHCIYGKGLPEHMEGLDVFVQTAFNMTIDNFRLGNTIVIGLNSRDGTVPDFDANTYYGGEFVNADVTSTTLGQDRTANFTQMYEVIQNLAIPGTGININQITGDTSKTAFEFSQRIKANTERAETMIKSWESGPLKRLGTLALSAVLSEMTTYDVEQLTGEQSERALKNIKAGRASTDDYTMENGKPVERKNRYYISMKGLREDFNTNKTRSYTEDSANNTLINGDPEKEYKIPLAKEYVYPDWFIESGAPFDVVVDSRRMLVNKKILDAQTLQIVLNYAMQGMNLDPEFAKSFDFSKFFKSLLERTEFTENEFMKEGESDKVIQSLRGIMKQADDIMAPQGESLEEMPTTSQMPSQPGQPLNPPIALQQAAQGSL